MLVENSWGSTQNDSKSVLQSGYCIQNVNMWLLYPKCEYVGLTRRSFKTRIGEHKQNVRSKNLETPSGFHFNQPGHDVSHFAGLVLEKVKSSDPFVLRAREFLHIQKFDSYRNGLNKEP